MKKLISLIFVALISSQMWANITITINGTPGYSGVQSVTAFRYTSTNSATGSTSDLSINTNGSSTYYYSSNAYYNKVYCFTVNPKSGNTVTWTFNYTSQTSAANVASATKDSYYVDGNKIYFKAYNSNQYTSGDISVNITATVTGSSSTGGGSTTTGSRSSVAAAKKDRKNVTVEYQANSGVYTDNIALPSDVVDMGAAGYWRIKNVGATNSTDAGYYYQWGTTNKNGNYFNVPTNTSNNYTHTLPTDKDLVSSNDAATVALDDGYCTPTYAEWNKLLPGGTSDNITWTYTSSYWTIKNSNTGREILIPANTKYYYSNWNFTSKKYELKSTSGGAGCYWSSSYNSGNPYTFQCTSSKKTIYGVTSSSNPVGAGKIDYGMFIRPIYNMTGTLYTLTIKVGSYNYKYKGVAGQKIYVTVNTPSTHTSAWKDDNSISTDSPRELEITSSNPTYEVVYTAAPTNYTVTFSKNEDWGSLSGTSITNIPSNSDITVDGGKVTINGSDITASPANQTAQYTYAFTGWTDGNGGDLPAKVTGNLTIRANFSRTLRNYDVTIAVSPEGYGSVDYESVTNVPYGTTITTSTNTVDINGTTVTATPTASTAEYTYAFSSWTNGTATVTGALTVTANFSRTVNNYSVTFKAADGTTTLQGPTNYSYGATITSCPIPVQQSGNTVFAGWTLNGNTSVVYTYEQIYNVMTVTGDMVFTAKYVPALSVTIPAFTNNGKVLVTANGTTYNVTSDGDEIYVANGSNVTIQAVPNAYYHFAAWKEDDQADDFIEYRPLNASVTYTPTWEQNVTLSLVDTENKAYYTDLYTDAEYAGKMLTVTMTGRRLTEGSWMTFCAPFEFDIPAGHALDGAVYRFINGTMTGTNTEGYISLDFVRTHKIEANVPYLVVAKTTTDTDLEFDGVTIEDAPEQKPVVASSRDVQFVSQPWKDALVNEALELADFYIASGNTLRYAKVGDPGTTIRAFRAYFHRLKDLNATPAPRRIVISLDGVETTKEIGVDGEIEDTTRKYMENGILYIERNGVRYNAQGQVAE